MKPKTKKIESEKESGGWGNALWSLAGNALTEAGNAVLERVDLWVSDLKRSAISTVFVIVGAVFLLISLVLYVNTLVPNEMHWLGFIFGGIFSVTIGYFFSRK